ncbi:D-aminoacyl-tRNA deacylase [Flavicella sp.]|uniref:D-aminoacyl-tRNA deacylase n=1 Tax=Flavicella sp. TaxID=2957742 RepID=UPI002623551D|nr:D-aminoacyl-tRNA deacylase [Flavicella sp.]MDG1805057.1 D-aminoacyl-tRNA deacylase [Flavicella sp.]MDG2279671.1 D-aminoacyl-tRNA deacylase [Flavicella sp.]
MKVVLQVVKEASVSIENKIFSEINHGLLILVGIEDSDSDLDINWLSNKITNMRVFVDENHTMNLSVKDVLGDILVVSQFTLQASTKKGHRPSYIKASKPDVAIPMYEKFVSQLETDLGKSVFTGVFGADMKVSLVNEGPVTIVMDSKDKK